MLAVRLLSILVVLFQAERSALIGRTVTKKCNDYEIHFEKARVRLFSLSLRLEGVQFCLGRKEFTKVQWPFERARSPMSQQF